MPSNVWTGFFQLYFPWLIVLDEAFHILFHFAMQKGFPLGKEDFLKYSTWEAYLKKQQTCLLLWKF